MTLSKSKDSIIQAFRLGVPIEAATPTSAESTQRDFVPCLMTDDPQRTPNAA